MELTRIGKELKFKNVRGGNNIPAEDDNSSIWLWQQINIERKVPWTPHGLFFFFFLQKNWLFLAVSKTIQKISKRSDLLLWQLWQAKFQWRVQSLEKLKEALWSLTSQGSKLCIYKKSKVQNCRRKISEFSSATSHLCVEACRWLNNDKRSSMVVVPQVVDSRICGCRGHRTYPPTPALFTGMPVVRVQLLAQSLGFSVYCCFLTSESLFWSCQRISRAATTRLGLLIRGWGVLFVCVCVRLD